jgi:PAS domain S-box-containing protein
MEIYKRLKKIMAPPLIKKDPSLNYQAEMINAFLMVLALFQASALIVPIYSSDYSKNLLAAATLLLVCIIFKIFIHKAPKFIRPVGILVVSICFLVQAITTWMNGGLRTAAFYSYILTIIWSGLIFSWTGALGTTIACSLFGLFIVWADANFLLPVRYIMPPIPLITTATIIFVIAALPLALVVKNLKKSLFQANQEIQERQRIEKALRDIEKQYRIITDNIRDTVWMMDFNLKLTYTSPHIEKLRGFSLEELWQMPIQQHLSPASWEIVKKNIPQVLDPEKLIQPDYDPLIKLELEYMRKDGASVWTETIVTIYRDEQGNPVGLLCVGRDINERKRAEELLNWETKFNSDMADLTSALLPLISIEECSQIILDYAKRLTDSPTGFAGYIEPAETQNIGLNQIPSYTAEHPAFKQTPQRLAALSEFWKHLLDRKTSLLTNTPEQDLKLSALPENHQTITRLIFAPAMVGEVLLGLITVNNAQNDYDSRDLMIIERLAAIYAITLQRIHAKNKLELSEQRLRGIIDSLHDLLFVFDKEGRFIDYHVPGELYFVTPEQFMGKHHAEVMPPEVNTLFTTAFQKIQEGGIAEYEYPLTTEMGINWYAAKLTPLQLDGKFSGAVSMIRDITAYKLTEETLARRVEERTTDLSLANLQLAKALRARNDFLATMSHELRTPLTGILGLTEGMHKGVYGSLTEKQNGILINIQESGRHLLSLINDILDLSRIEAGKIEFRQEPVVLKDICRAALRLVEQAAHKKRLKIHHQFDDGIGIILADDRRLKQILVNLLDNAVKFTQLNGSVGLEVTGDPANQQLIITVWDTGIGIAPENISRLFEPFVQLDDRLSREYNGTGLGLSLVHKLTILQEGKVEVQSEPNKGSRFTITLPWKQLQSSGSRLPMTEIIHPTLDLTNPIKILVAEDNQVSLELLTDFLCSKGYQVYQATNGQEALEQTLLLRPDLIIMDIQMPVMDGLEVIRRLRQDQNLPQIPIIALTALAMLGDQKRCLEAGANVYMSKPFGLVELQEIVFSQLSSQQ